jgi:type IV pilus assembly protein PilC
VNLLALPFLNRITIKDRAFLSRQIATMLSSGIPLTEALKVMLTGTKSPRVAEAIEQIIKDVESGLSFSVSIQKHPELFNSVYVSMAKSGEASGRLEDVLLQMADNIELEQSIISRVRGAMIYPLFIVVAMIGVSILMLVSVIPQLQLIFDESKVQLPLATRFLIALSNFLIHQWWLCIAIVAIIVFAARFYAKTPAGVYFINQVQARLPGQLSESLYMARFTRTMSMLIQAGLPIIESLDIAGAVMNNVIYRDSLLHAKTQVERGIPLSTPLSQNKFFPVLVAQMVRVGEQTGRLDDVLKRLSVYYESELDTRIKSISSLIEPVIIVILGIAVAFLVISILMPIYSIAQLQ